MLVSILAIILISLVIAYHFCSIKERRHHPLVAIYPSAVPEHDSVNNTEQFLSDLDLVKSLCFEGVRLHQKDYEDYGYGRVADDLNDRDLKFVMVLQSWNNSQFPENETYVNQLIAYFKNVADQLKNKCNLLWYAMDYPFDWFRKDDYVNIIYSQEYRSALQSLITNVHSIDRHHPIYLISGMIENVTYPVLFKPPTDFLYVEGYGIMPYSPVWMKDRVDKQRISDWISVYKETGKEVYIAEWGVQTIENSPNRTYNYGLASNETMKVKMIQEFVDYIYDWDIYWDYFGLHDFPIENSDWGIVYYNNTLKPSGQVMKEVLAKGNNQTNIIVCVASINSPFISITLLKRKEAGLFKLRLSF